MARVAKSLQLGTRILKEIFISTSQSLRPSCIYTMRLPTVLVVRLSMVSSKGALLDVLGVRCVIGPSKMKAQIVCANPEYPQDKGER